MKTSFLVSSLMFLFLTIPFTRPASADQMVELHEAARKGYISLSASSNGGYARVRLDIRNLTRVRLKIDPSGSYLVPRFRRCQRLGLGPIVAPKKSPRRSFIQIEPLGVWGGEVQCCCMDEGRPSPGGGQTFSLARGRSSSRIYKALKHWGRNPRLPQSMVNKVVWGKAKVAALETHSDCMQLDPSVLLADGGRLYWLSEGGALYSAMAGEAFKKIADDVDHVAVGAGQVVTYTPLAPRARLFNTTERRWEEEMLPGNPQKMLPAFGGGMYCLLTNGQLFCRRPGSGGYKKIAQALVKSFGITPVPVSSILFVLQGGTQGSIVFADNEKADLLAARRARDIAVSARSVYAIESGGVYRLGDKRKCVAQRGWTLRAGRFRSFIYKNRCLRGIDEKTGRTQTLAKLPQNTSYTAVDRITDTLFVVDGAQTLFELDGKVWIERGHLPKVE